MWNPTTILFCALQAASVVASLLTFYLLSTAPPPPPTTHSLNRHTPPQQPYALLRLFSLNAAFVSAIILIPGAVYAFDLRQASPLLCWIQGLSLNFAFLTQHLLAFFIVMQLWMLIVRRSVVMEARFARYYYKLIYGLPMLVVTLYFLIAGHLSGWSWNTNEVSGVQPQAAYCFQYKPFWLRMFTYTGWFMLLSLPGMVMAVWTAIHLFRLRARQERELSAAGTRVMTTVVDAALPTVVSVVDTRQQEQEGAHKETDDDTTTQLDALQDDTDEWSLPPPPTAAIRRASPEPTPTRPQLPTPSSTLPFFRRLSINNSSSSPSASAAPTPHGHTRAAGRSFLSRTPSILYRTSVFALLYTLVSVLTWVPALVQQIHYAQDSAAVDARERAMIEERVPTAGEFTSALSGIAALLIFGTGRDGLGRWRRRRGG